ncbi:hypothetical protein MFIFM68171_02935 [Madurella fahalii]|uniref:ABC transmembrane type-1 domain-containing protein n=1 Tax=Madurella fahalii TaxID=1157608 RepID=A0ABQ0G4M4_9PEZI
MYPLPRILSTAASTVFLLWLPFRLSRLRTETIKLIPQHGGHRKLMIAIVLALVQPSDLAIVYLLVTLVCDSIEFGTFVNEDDVSYGAGLAMANLWVKLVLEVAESRGKAAIQRGQWSPEESAGLLARVFFWWINPILAKGNRNILTGECLPPLDQKLSSKLRRQRALQAWAQRAKPEKEITLSRILQSIITTFGSRLLGILMAIVVYVGLAVSKAMYQHCLNRLKIMIRGAVAGLINNRSLSRQSNDYDDGRAVTLVTTDAENAVEVVLGMSMLAREVGWVFPVPLIIFFCSRMSRYLAKNLQGKQKDWTVATQKRIAMTISMLASMKSLKMLGITPYTESLIHNLRVQELSKAMKVRWMMVAYNASANALGIFSPIVTFVLFVIVASWNDSALDTATAFTTTALLGLITHPANMIMTIIPQAVGSSPLSNGSKTISYSRLGMTKD